MHGNVTTRFGISFWNHIRSYFLIYAIKMVFIIWGHLFKRTIRLASRYYHFSIKIAICNRKFYSSRFLARTSTLSFKKLNATSICVFCPPEYFLFIFLSLHFSLSPFFFTHNGLVALSPFFRWNYFKKIYILSFKS